MAPTLGFIGTALNNGLSYVPEEEPNRPLTVTSSERSHVEVNETVSVSLNSSNSDESV